MIWKAVTCVVALLAGTTAALAHAQLVKATPAANSVSPSSPTDVVLQFNEKLESAFASLRVTDASGQQVDKKDARVDKSDLKSLRVSLPPLKAGSYKVQWRATAADLHKMEGAFTFRVGE